MVKLIFLYPTQTTGKAKELLAQVDMLPKIIPKMVRSPPTLEGYLNFNTVLARGVIGCMKKYV